MDDQREGIAHRIRLPGDHCIEIGVADSGQVTLSTQVKDGPVTTVFVPAEKAKELSALVVRLVRFAEESTVEDQDD